MDKRSPVTAPHWEPRNTALPRCTRNHHITYLRLRRRIQHLSSAPPRWSLLPALQQRRSMCVHQTTAEDWDWRYDPILPMA
ncbi:hypothetical protein GDO81_018301 [Engystomops pustulosus]|uniref:Uncharacterized protein n=1 Tax=Engystomops pustulosus TaxID=76066 RepID=A0AAV7AG41_ENGPU|nr:hypothetical protein GDO81_018301 [Engystomops pustulosus]